MRGAIFLGLALALLTGCPGGYSPPEPGGPIDLFPAISPDGEWIVYTRYDSVQPGGFFIARIGGGSPELLVPDWGVADWSPDGRSLAVAVALQIYRLDLATKQLVPLTTAGFNSAPVWSPDGRTIAFGSNNDDGRYPPDLWLMNPDGSRRRRVPLPSPRDELSDVDWSPAGDRIVGPSNNGLFITDTLGRDTVYLPTGTSFDAAPAWSPTGEWIAYSYALPEKSYPDLWLIRPDGTGKRRLIRQAAHPAWFPDGARLAVVRPGSDAQNVWAVDLGGRVVQQLTRSVE